MSSFPSFALLCLSLCLLSSQLQITSSNKTTTTTTTPVPWTPYPPDQTCPKGLSTLLQAAVNGDRLVQGYQKLRLNSVLSTKATAWAKDLEAKKGITGMTDCYQPNLTDLGQAFCWCSAYAGDRDDGLPVANIDAEVRANVRPRFGGANQSLATFYTPNQWKHTTALGLGCGRSWDAGRQLNHICIVGLIDKPKQ